MKKKKIIKVTSLGILLIFIVGIAYFNVLFPMKIEPVKIECINWDATYPYVEAFEESYKTGEYDKDTTIIHNFDGTLPSHNPDDYASVYIDIKATNRCFFDHFSVDGYISKIEKNSDMALWSATLSSVISTTVFRTSSSGATINMDLYVKDRSDEEIKEMLRSITIDVVYKGDILGKRTATVQLADVEDITIER